MNEIDCWNSHVNPALLPALKKIPKAFSYNSPLKAKIFSALMHIPGPTLEGVESEHIKGIGRFYFPQDDSNKRDGSSAILWIHGGGRIMGSPHGANERFICSRIVKTLGVPVLGVAYRLAPKYPFPAALDDILAAYHYLHKKLSSQAGNKEAIRIAVAGESAGGGLAAEICQRLLDEMTSKPTADAAPMPVAQFLVYPMLDDRTCTNEENIRCPPHLIWNIKSNKYAWTSYLGRRHKPGEKSLPPYAAAARRDNLSNLPPAWIVVGNLDLFRDECKDYSERLNRCSVKTRYLEVDGGYHGFLSLGRDEDPVLQVWQDLKDFAQAYL